MRDFQLGAGRRHGFDLGHGLLHGKLLAISDRAFVSTWNTENTSAGSSTSSQVSLPLLSSGTYDFVVDWGDGNTDAITTWNQSETTHTYSSPGVYQIRLTGDIDKFQFNNGKDKLKLVNIAKWGDLIISNAAAFYGCTNLTCDAGDVPNITGATSLYSMFRDCSVFNGALNAMDTSSITNISRMFQSALAFNQPLNLWDATNFGNMSVAFWHADAFAQDISSWTPTSVTNLFQTFSYSDINCDIGHWPVAACTNMYGCFQNTPFDQDISAWDISNVTEMTSFLLGGAFSTANYDALLVAWEALSVQNNVAFHGGSSKYSAGAPATARAALVADHSWTITDGGAV